MTDQASVAFKTFEMENEIVTLDPNIDGIFRYDKDTDRAANAAKPWKTEWVSNLQQALSVKSENRLMVNVEPYPGCWMWEQLWRATEFDQD